MTGNLLARTALMASVAALLQLAAGYLPGPGHVLSAFATLPIFMIASLSPRAGVACLLSASVVVSLIHPVETPILLLMTGPLGLSIGWCRFARAGAGWTVFAGATVLWTGMLAVTYGLGMPALGPIARARDAAGLMMFYMAFALLYAWVWVYGLRRWERRLNPVQGQASRI